LHEADSIADIHLAIKDKLLNDVQAEIKRWKSENYHKGMLGQCKESKTLEDEFKKVGHFLPFLLGLGVLQQFVSIYRLRNLGPSATPRSSMPRKNITKRAKWRNPHPFRKAMPEAMAASPETRFVCLAFTPLPIYFLVLLLVSLAVP
jgi:hypothetical protein